MAETGGPIFEGSSTRPVEAQPKQGVVDYVKMKWTKKVEENLRQQANFKESQKEWRKLGKTVETKYVEAYDKIASTLGEGKLKKAAEIVRPIVKLNAKIARVGMGVVDTVIAAVPYYIGSRLLSAGGIALFRDAKGNRNYKASQVFAVLGAGTGATVLGGGILWLSPIRRSALSLFEFVGNRADKASHVTKKILSGTPKAAA